MALLDGMRYLIFAGDRSQYVDWCDDNSINPHDSSRVVYAGSVRAVRGLQNVRPIITGTFWSKPDSEAIWNDAQPAFFDHRRQDDGPLKEWFPGRWGYSQELLQLQRFVPGWIVPGTRPQVDLTIDVRDIDGLVTALDEAGLIKPRLDDRLLEAEREHVREAMKVVNKLVDKLSNR